MSRKIGNDYLLGKAIARPGNKSNQGSHSRKDSTYIHENDDHSSRGYVEEVLYGIDA